MGWGRCCGGIQTWTLRVVGRMLGRGEGGAKLCDGVDILACSSVMGYLSRRGSWELGSGFHHRRRRSNGRERGIVMMRVSFSVMSRRSTRGAVGVREVPRTALLWELAAVYVIRKFFRFDLENDTLPLLLQRELNRCCGSESCGGGSRVRGT